MNLMDIPRTEVVGAVTKMLSSGGHLLEVAAQDILSLDIKLANALVDAVAGERPYYRDNIRDVIGALATPTTASSLVFGPGPVFWNIFGSGVLHIIRRRRHEKKRRHIIKAAPLFVIRRPVLSLRNAEKAALKAMALLFAQRRIDRPTWQSFIGALTWNNGREVMLLPPDWKGHAHIDEARKFIEAFARMLWPDAQAIVANAAHALSRHARGP